MYSDVNVVNVLHFRMREERSSRRRGYDRYDNNRYDRGDRYDRGERYDRYDRDRDYE